MSAQSKFKAEVERDASNVLVGRWVLERVPFIFDGDEEGYRQWRYKLAASLTVDPCDVVMTGSAAVGFSLSPFKGLRAFDENSDIDVAVISPFHFDTAWRFLRQLGSRRFSFSPAEKRSVDEHRRNLVYWGTIATDRLLPRLPFGRVWLEGTTRLEAEEPAEGRSINLRLYRDFEALRSYQMSGLESLKKQLLRAQEDS